MNLVKPIDFAAPAAAEAGGLKFSDPDRTLGGDERARVPLTRLDTLWINTGTLCNITCTDCYIESTPKNDSLVYLKHDEVAGFLHQAARLSQRPQQIGFTGGEPFMNPDIMAMLSISLAAGFGVLVLTNAMRPMQRHGAALLALHRKYPGRLSLRVSVDHYVAEKHEHVRGPRTWAPALEGIRWLASNGFALSIAGRLLWDESEESLRAGYAAAFAANAIPVDAHDPGRLVLFPEMDPNAEVPEITEACWGLLGKSPRDVMCASSRMVVKRKGSDAPAVVACTLLPYDPRFELGATLAAAERPVALNHRHCAKFCVLGGASCSSSR